MSFSPEENDKNVRLLAPAEPVPGRLIFRLFEGRVNATEQDTERSTM